LINAAAYTRVQLSPDVTNDGGHLLLLRTVPQYVNRGSNNMYSITIEHKEGSPLPKLPQVILGKNGMVKMALVRRA